VSYRAPMQAMPDSADSLVSKREAAELLGLSERAVARHAQAGRLRAHYERAPGGGERVYYYRAEVESLRDVLAQAQRRGLARSPVDTLLLGVQASSREPNERGEQLQTVAAQLDTALGQLVEVLRAELPRIAAPAGSEPARARPLVAVSDKLTLTKREAAALAGLPMAEIKRAVAKGRLRAVELRGGKVRIKRADLDAYVRKL